MRRGVNRRHRPRRQFLRLRDAARDPAQGKHRCAELALSIVCGGIAGLAVPEYQDWQDGNPSIQKARTNPSQTGCHPDVAPAMAVGMGVLRLRRAAVGCRKSLSDTEGAVWGVLADRLFWVAALRMADHQLIRNARPIMAADCDYDLKTKKNLPGGRFFSPKEAANQQYSSIPPGMQTFVRTAGILHAALHRLPRGTPIPVRRASVAAIRIRTEPGGFRTRPHWRAPV